VAKTAAAGSEPPTKEKERYANTMQQKSHKPFNQQNKKTLNHPSKKSRRGWDMG